MDYQVLARKWRPHNFSEVVGQQHVLQALSNALTHQRLHHAYLLTGTRGVGKTTIARILAKSLNCEQGISATPCGQCDTCLEIDQGRYVDLLEIDAASRTKVEDTRELLDNVQYRPTRGRYKVYLIDEVHMLSRHSFNALLKTLEEPPEHVKFLLATTDPEKLPVTVLSRCLQFHLRALTREEIGTQLRHILSSESLEYNDEAVALLARAARGSMRDALSLTDQAIAQGNQSVELDSVRQMLGHIEGRRVLDLLQLIASGDAADTLQMLREMQDKIPDVATVLPELQNALHQIALLQVSADFADSEVFKDMAQLQDLAAHIPAELVQVLYRMVLEGRRELPFALDAYTAVEMTLLRMLAFRPQDMAPVVGQAQGGNQASRTVEQTEQIEQPQAVQEHAVFTQEDSALPDDDDEDFISPEEQASLAQEQDMIVQQAEVQRPAHAIPSAQADVRPPAQPAPTSGEQSAQQPDPMPGIDNSASLAPEESPQKAAMQSGSSDLEKLLATREALLAKKKAPLTPDTRSAAEVDAWSASVDNLPATGRIRQVLLHSRLKREGDGYKLVVDEQQQVLCTPSSTQELERLLRELVGDDIPLTLDFAPVDMTPYVIQQAIDHYRAEHVLASIKNNPTINHLMQRFDATLDESSVTPH